MLILCIYRFFLLNPLAVLLLKILLYYIVSTKLVFHLQESLLPPINDLLPSRKPRNEVHKSCFRPFLQCNNDLLLKFRDRKEDYIVLSIDLTVARLRLLVLSPIFLRRLLPISYLSSYLHLPQCHFLLLVLQVKCPLLAE